MNINCVRAFFLLQMSIDLIGEYGDEIFFSKNDLHVVNSGIVKLFPDAAHIYHYPFFNFSLDYGSQCVHCLFRKSLV